MSPEQALAKRVLVDHRTDIYSLGATLYELLTLETPFAGSDRQELLRQIAFVEPRVLRRVNKAIPAELETIVLKAIEKNPDDRYARDSDPVIARQDRNPVPRNQIGKLFRAGSVAFFILTNIPEKEILPCGSPYPFDPCFSASRT